MSSFLFGWMAHSTLYGDSHPRGEPYHYDEDQEYTSATRWRDEEEEYPSASPRRMPTLKGFVALLLVLGLVVLGGWWLIQI